MKNWFIIVLLAFAMPVGFTACSTPPAQRVVAVQSLLIVGHSAESAVQLSAQLYRDGKITPAQARAVIDFYDIKFQPAYRLAVATVQSDLSAPASPQVLDLATQLLTLVNSYVK